MRPERRHVVHAAIADAGQIEPCLHLSRGQWPESRFHQGFQGITVIRAFRHRIKSRILGERCIVQHLVAKGGPLALVLQPEHDAGSRSAASAGLEWAVGINRRVAGARARRRRRAFISVVERKAHPLGQGFEHRDVDVRAIAGLAAQQQGVEDGAVGIHAGRNVSHRNAGLGR